MRLTINGQPAQTECATLADLLAALDYTPAAVATAVNQAFVPLEQRETYRLADHDAIEIIAPMAGG